MTTAKVLEFPYSRIRLDTEKHVAKILRLRPERNDVLDTYAILTAAAVVWLSMFGFQSDSGAS